MATKRRGRSQEAIDLAKDILAYENKEPCDINPKCRYCKGQGNPELIRQIEQQTWGSEQYKQEILKKYRACKIHCRCQHRGGRNRAHGPALVEIARLYLKWQNYEA